MDYSQWNKHFEDSRGDFVLIRSAWVDSNGLFTETQPVSGGTFVKKGWVGPNLSYITDPAENKFYDIIILAGQSNAAGFDKLITNVTAGTPGAPTSPNANVKFVNDWQETSTVPDDRYSTTDGTFEDLRALPSVKTNVFGAEMSMGQDAFSVYNAPNPVIVKVACGSSGLYQHGTQMDWNINTTSDTYSLYKRLVDKINQAISLVPAGYFPRIKAFVWNQGERESSPTVSGISRSKMEAYKSNLLALIGDLRTTFRRYHASSMKIITTRSIQTQANYTDTGTLGFTDPVVGSNVIGPVTIDWSTRVRLAQIQIAEEDASNGSKWISTDDFSVNSANSAGTANSDIHYTADEYVYLGRKYAEAIYENSNVQIYENRFINNTVTNTPPSNIVGVRKYNWFAWGHTGTPATTASLGTPTFRPAHVISNYRLPGTYYTPSDTTRSLGGMNFTSASAANLAVIAKCDITQLAPNAANKPIPLSKLKKIAFYLGCGNTTTFVRILIKAGGNYYLNETDYSMGTAATTASIYNVGTAGGAELKENTVDLSATNWRQFADVSGEGGATISGFGVTPSEFPLVTEPLNPSLYLEEIGLYAYNGASTNLVFVRLPNFRIEVQL